jgi:hypothetical protein
MLHESANNHKKLVQRAFDQDSGSYPRKYITNLRKSHCRPRGFRHDTSRDILTARSRRRSQAVPQPDHGALDELVAERGDKKQQNQIERKSLD